MPISIRTLGDVRDRKRRDSQLRFLAQHILAPLMPLPFFLPPCPLALSTPATQATSLLPSFVRRRVYTVSAYM